MNPVLHIVIVWSTAINHKEEIVNDIKERFDLLRIIKVHWDKSLFFENLKIFYSHSLKDKSEDKMESILKGKISTIGNNDFYVIFFYDNNPCMENRVTTSGEAIVNTKIFDLKEKYRKKLTGTSIHSSNDAWETNKDLTILFGKNTEDFIADESIGEIYSKNCIGVSGYDSLEQLFYVLNNTIDYCVLRNFEGIPEQYTLEGHDDIDLLVSHRDYAVRLTNAQPVFPQSYRVYHHITIKGKKVAFDFRHVGDDYYDKIWEKKILETRTMQKNLFYVPAPTERFYTLLYHAYVQKPRVKDDYYPKLARYANEIKVNYNKDILSSMILLTSYLKLNKYAITKAKDKSVHYNKKHVLLIEGYEFFNNIGYEDLSPVHLDSNSWSGYVYFVGKYNGRKVFIKYGGIDDSCLNEYRFTKRMWDMDNNHYVEPITNGNNKNTNYIVFEYCDLVSLGDYLKRDDNKENMKSQLIEIYKELQKAKVMHRDIRPDNLCVVNGNLKLLDLQYAIDTVERKELSCVDNNILISALLGDVINYRYKPYAWKDSYSVLQVSKQYQMGIDSSNLKPADKPYFMNLYKYSRYFIRIKLMALKEKLHI